MKLESLIVTHNYGTPRKYAATIKFSNDFGSTELKLPEDMTERLLAVVGDALVDASKGVAQQLTAATIEQVTKVEVKALERLREGDPDVL